MQNFRAYYLRRLDEIRDGVARDLSSWGEENEDQLPFNDLFGGEGLREVVPFQADPIALSILEKIKQDGLKINYREKIVYDPETLRGTEKGGSVMRKQRLGKYVLGKRSPFTSEEKKWFQTQGQALESLETAEQAHKYAIIVSRHPVDVVRMSDHDGWTSCHSTPEKSGGGNYFHCAMADAKGGGAVAYTVSKEDAKKAMESEEWENGEIFRDDDRRIRGISPANRVRLRMFVHKEEGYDLAVPEVRSYGKRISGFKDTVTKWAKEKQSEKFGGKRVSMDDFERKGGSYQDSNASKLFNSFFDDSRDSGDADYTGEDDSGGNMGEQYEEEIEALDREYPQTNRKYAYAMAEVELTQFAEVYVHINMGISIDIPKDMIQMTLPTHRMTGRRERRPSNTKILTDVIKAAAKEIDIYSVQEVAWYSREDAVSIRVDAEPDCTDYYGNDIQGNPDCYRQALETSAEWEEKGPQFEKLVYLGMQRLGYLNSSIHKHLSQWGEDHENDIPTFKNFFWDDDDLDKEGTIQVQMGNQEESQQFAIGNVHGVQQDPMSGWQATQNKLDTFQHVNVQYSDEIQAFKKLFTDRLLGWSERIWQQDQKQGRLWPEMKPKTPDHSFTDIKLRPSIGVNIDYEGNVYMRLEFEFHTVQDSEDIDKAVQFIQFLDKSPDGVVREAQQIWSTVTRADMQKRYDKSVEQDARFKREREIQKQNAQQVDQAAAANGGTFPATIGEPKPAG